MSTAAGQVAAEVHPQTHPAQNTRTWIDWISLLLALLIILLTCLGQSATKPFWYDELVTLRIASLPSAGDIIHFYETGKDTTSFLPALILHWCQHLPGKPEVTLRLPFTLAYLVLALCLWSFMRRRYATGFAVAVVLLLPQGSTLYFASETRAYAFVLMGTAIAMASWQAANEGRRSRTLATLGVFLGLSIAVLFHFFAIFLFVPFAVAEWYRMRSAGQRRWGMWAAILLFPATLAVMVPNILAARQVYGKTFWSRPSVGLLTDTYTFSLLAVGRYLIAFILVIAGFLWFRGRFSLREKTVQNTGFTRSEWVLLLGLSLVPVFAFIGSLFLGLFRSQYVLYFEAAMVLIITASIAEVLQREYTAGWVLGGVMLLLLATHVRGDLSSALLQLSGKPTGLHPAEYDPNLYAFLQPTRLPVVSDGALVLLPLEHYSPEDLKRRLVGLTSRKRALLFPMSVTTDLNLETFGPVLHFPLQDFDSFVAGHRDFLLVVYPRWQPYSWLFSSLLEESQTKHDLTMQIVYTTPAVDGSSESVYLIQYAPAGLSAQTAQTAQTAPALQ